ncbi:hypothetical protein B1B04_08330 [Lysinibacillus sp. KCTC 33748]|uniref:hypothetical protein n=1 Tax=unclassified Lysinibacillus TaxID=2636778 RepID=UPI0009A8A001|nr:MULTISPECIES: hypothetical protein [unclassified Lysinibacillus]OXS74889.1 hypothetical protein B1B04_08330 [Lysinibacillus sp. KCTC 33748]SKB59280.1 hypothetical protein SAMN06295926_104147 [Lysinibacillus sp. AC-3]
MDLVEKLKLKIAMLEACNEDLLVAIGVHNNRGEYHLSAECMRKINKTIREIERLKAHLRDQQNFMWVIKDLQDRGLLGEVMKKYANQA